MSIESIINYTLGIAGILIGVIVSFYTYRKAKETKEPMAYYQTYRNIEKIDNSDHESNIKVFYKSEEVDRVYTTYVWFWNNGKRPIIKSDIPSGSELKLIFFNQDDNLRILDFKILKQSRNAINAKLSKADERSLKIELDFLDYEDGVAIEVQHTGGIEAGINFDGIILGHTDGVLVKTVSARGYVDPSPPKKITPFEIVVYGSITALIWLAFASFVLYLGLDLYAPEKMPGFLEFIFSRPEHEINYQMTSEELRVIIDENIPEATDESVQAVIDSVYLNRPFMDKIQVVLFYGLIIFLIILPIGMSSGITKKDYPFPVSLTFKKRE